MTNEFVALEEDMITGSKVDKLVVRRLQGAEGDAERATSGPTVADKALRLNGDRAVLVSISMLSDRDNLKFVRIIVESGKPTEEWHGHQNR